MKQTMLLPLFVTVGALSLWLPGTPALAKTHPKAHHAQPPAPTYQEVIPTSEKTSQVWKYTTAKPAKTWFTPGFNDSAWKQGKGGFGAPKTPGIGLLGTHWTKTPGDIWLRRTFNPGALTPAQISQLFVHDYHDEDIEVYINGVKAYSAPGFIASYEYKPLSPAAKQAIHPGAANTLAVHCHQTGGGQYIDVGLSELIPNPAK